MNTYRYSWIYENFPKDKSIEYDYSLLQVATIDIETGSENGFPNPVSATEEVQAITKNT